MTAIPVPPTQAAPNMMPDYKVRLLLSPEAVLDPKKELMDTVRSALKISPTVSNMNVQFLDTSPKDLFDADWSVRIRKTEGQDDLELTYKKRYTIKDGDIDAALIAAKNDGFNAENSKYESQVEWG
ncbi:uncharacterized protein N7483_007116 [Penicillium malachiteum]|uniref:uncharacterized protein n=1 Tax=Penicillium malachiteum TaxID=1324776 RepID=UPI002547B802|nr:uncharacterized protein N7483_007116 [Penicillium malachiteum]KAJ5725759.1 hypothetical protein N7483_007116 [Penicillium malachiteum]